MIVAMVTSGRLVKDLIRLAQLYLANKCRLVMKIPPPHLRTQAQSPRQEVLPG